MKLTEKTHNILGCIAQGYGYEAILRKYPQYTFFDIAETAQEVLGIVEYIDSDEEEPTKAYNVVDIRKRYPNAYRLWSTESDDLLRHHFKKGRSIKELAQLFGRQPGGIKGRLKKLELLNE